MPGPYLAAETRERANNQRNKTQLPQIIKNNLNKIIISQRASKQH